MEQNKEVTLGVAIITKNRVDQLKRLLPQLVKMDQVVVCDTGSQDGTERYVRSLGKPFQYIRFAWRDKPTKKNPEFGFAAARNASFAAIKTTHAVWLDTDDMVGQLKGNKPVLATPEQVYGVFKKIAVEADPITDVWYIKYVYARDEDGNPNAVHTRERMVKMSSGWRWIWPVHENLVPPRERHPAEVKDLDIIHFPDERNKQSGERNLKIVSTWLEWLEANDGNEMDIVRCKLNVGESLAAMERHKEAADFLVRRFIKEHPRALDMEKWHAWTIVAKMQMDMANFEAARAAALACIDIEPGLVDGYILLAQIKFAGGEDPQDVLLLLDQAGHVEEPPSQMITNPLDYTFTPYCIISDCKFQQGQYDEALKWALKAQALRPADPRPEGLRMKAADAVRKRDAREAAKALFQLLQDYDENEKAAKIFENLPYVAQQSEEVQDLAKKAYERVRHLFDRNEYIRLYTGNSRWTAAKEEWIEQEAPPGMDRYLYILGRLQAALPNGGRILDVGCSDGFHSLLFAKHGYEVVGVDLDPRCVQVANERAQKFGVPAKFVHGFFEDLEPTQVADPFDPARSWFQNFDAVVCAEVIEHVQDPSLLLGCLGDCAKDGSPIIITTPDEAFDKGDTPSHGGSDESNTGLVGHVRVFTQESFEAVLRSNSEFDVVEARFLPIQFGKYRDNQGWQVGEIRRRERAQGAKIRIFCGDTLAFSPHDLNTGGIGGSETAVIQMAKAWAAKGCQVVVYSGINGIYDGVYYRTADHFDVKLESDVFISWRLPQAFQYGRPNAKITMLWCHDLHYPVQLPGLEKNEYPKAWVDAMDYVLVLSKFHKAWMEKAHPCFKSKLYVTRNGIDPTRFTDRKVERVPHRYFYSSSYDRGLEQLLEVWPKIKEAIPDAELNVAYGLQSVETFCKQTGDYSRLNWLNSIANKMDALDGVTAHDRIGQQELADLQLSCEAWLYPPQPDANGGWLETYCITALEAQAAGCKIISRLNGALPEVIKHCIKWRDDLDIVDILANIDKYWDSTWTKENKEYALSQTWDSLAVDWALEFTPKEAVPVS